MAATTKAETSRSYRTMTPAQIRNFLEETYGVSISAYSWTSRYGVNRASSYSITKTGGRYVSKEGKTIEYQIPVFHFTDGDFSPTEASMDFDNRRYRITKK